MIQFCVCSGIEPLLGTIPRLPVFKQRQEKELQIEEDQGRNDLLLLIIVNTLLEIGELHPMFRSLSRLTLLPSSLHLVPCLAFHYKGSALWQLSRLFDFHRAWRPCVSIQGAWHPVTVETVSGVGRWPSQLSTKEGRARVGATNAAVEGAVTAVKSGRSGRQ